MNDPTTAPPKQLDIFLDAKETPCVGPQPQAAKPRLFVIGGGRVSASEPSPARTEQAIWDAVLKRASKLGW